MTNPVQGPFLIGIDIGTSSVKAVMAGVGGNRLDSYIGAHATFRPSKQAVEQVPADWMGHVTAALDQFAAHPLARGVAAIGITSQVNTHVFCGADLAPLHPAITWADTRAAPQAARLDRAIDAGAKIAALGAPIPIDASHALSRMAWIAETHPDIWATTAHVLLPKDYVIAQLTGAVSADPISAVGLVGPDLRYAPALLALMPRADAVLPVLRDPLEIVGTLRAGPFAGVPVASGTMDAWASMFGLGVAREGEAMYLSGTSDVLAIICKQRHGTPGVITFPDWRGITLHAAPTQSGGASLAWLARLMDKDVAALGALATSAPITALSPLFLPHLDGERAPLWDPTSRGVFARMTSATGPAELAAAVMEGAAFSARMAIEALEASSGQRTRRLRHGGGGSVDDNWCQIRATALGRTLERVAAPDAGAMGALVMAGVASGQMPDLGGAIRRLVVPERDFLPDRAAQSLADARFAAYCDLYSALGPINHRLDRLIG